jgi:selenide,water dikinase
MECAQAGIFSTLHPDNLRSKRAIADVETASQLDRYPLLFDPQTAGGLLASVPEGRATECLNQLQQRGYPRATIIGRVAPLLAHETPISIA